MATDVFMIVSKEEFQKKAETTMNLIRDEIVNKDKDKNKDIAAY